MNFVYKLNHDLAKELFMVIEFRFLRRSIRVVLLFVALCPGLNQGESNAVNIATR